MDWLFIGIGGALGAMTRYSIGRLFANLKIKFPIATVIVNLLGSFIFGILIASSLKVEFPSIYIFLTGGFLGALTTFSTFSLESVNLFQSNLKSFVLYLSIHLFLGVSLAGLGFMLAKTFNL